MLKVLPTLHRDLAEQAWNLYHDAFIELNSLTVQRHLMHRHEFDEVLADPRVDVYLSFGADGDLRGLATYTNQLEAMPLISPAYFARRWPEQYAAGRVWYCGFVATIRDGSRAAGAFIELITSMYQVAEAQGGVISLDICQYNDGAHQLPRRVELLLRRVSGGTVRAMQLDEQRFYGYETWKLEESPCPA